MTYKVIASPLKGHKVIRTVEGVRELHDFLEDCHEQGMEVKRIARIKHMVRLSQEAVNA